MNADNWGAMFINIAGIVLPLIFITFIYIVNKDILSRLGKIHIVLIAVGVSLIFRLFDDSIPITVKTPIYNLMLSGIFADLVFRFVENQRKALIYYYGIITIMLICLIALTLRPLTLK